MHYFDQYLARHQHSPKILKFPSEETSIIVVIPCFDEPDIIMSLESLKNSACENICVEVIVVVNFGEQCDADAKEFNRNTFAEIERWAAENNERNFNCYAVFAPDLPAKFAGVGLARKIGMDEAIYRFNQINNENGIICGFDADAKVAANYLSAVNGHFLENPRSPGVSVYFEHPVSEISDQKMKLGIIQYESHLRYLVQAIRFSGYKNSFHTVGSSFAVRASAYVKQGGMNKFKAGEDFYFLNKIIALGGYSEINNTVVYPKARVSGRVPFGTGASMTRWMEGNENEFLTYQFASFLPLKELFRNIEKIYHYKNIPKSILENSTLKQFLELNEAEKAVEEIYNNSSSLQSFTKRFFTWFDAFRIVKYLNFATQNGYPKSPVRHESQQLGQITDPELQFRSYEEMLEYYRNWDKTGLPQINP